MGFSIGRYSNNIHNPLHQTMMMVSWHNTLRMCFYRTQHSICCRYLVLVNLMRYWQRGWVLMDYIPGRATSRKPSMKLIQTNLKFIRIDIIGNGFITSYGLHPAKRSQCPESLSYQKKGWWHGPAHPYFCMTPTFPQKKKKKKKNNKFFFKKKKKKNKIK